MPRPLVFLHGMFMTPRCWSDWLPRFRAAGFDATAPAWPLHDFPPDELRRRHPEAVLGRLTLDELVTHFEKLLRAMPEKPALVGHSMGGLLVQLLLARGLATAGVAIDSAPPKGVLSLKWSFLKSNWPMISPFAPKHEPHLLTLEQFRYAFAHTLTDAELRTAYAEEVAPESRLVANGPTTPIAKIDFAAPRPPLLLVAGGADRIIPASLNRKNFRKYPPSAGVTDFHEFPGRAHYTLGQSGWQEVADYVLDWLKTHVS
jgi:pimeloyl-ACP methyl ester carboxylesterase